MEYSVSCGTGMELAFYPDANDEEWTQFLDFSEVEEEEHAPLQPVTWSDEAQCFYGAQYGLDGRLIGITRQLSDELNANQSDSSGCYIIRTFYARTGENVSVSLAPATIGADGTEGSGTYLVGSPEWNEETISHDNAGLGFEYAIRVGLRITHLEDDGISLSDDSVFYIYEPNCDSHVMMAESGAAELIVDDSESLDYFTPSIDDPDLPLTDTAYIIKQTTSSWSESDPVERGVVIQELGKFLSEEEEGEGVWLFDLYGGEMVQIDVYIWLEGQDVDCSNLIGQSSKLFLNLQFKAEAENASGLEEIR